MSRLDEYRSALLVAFPEVTEEELGRVLDAGGPQFVTFVIDHGLGPLWHERTGRGEFQKLSIGCRSSIPGTGARGCGLDSVLEEAGIEYALIKGAASRLLLHDNPAVRACYDLDLLVRREQRVLTAATPRGRRVLGAS